MEGAGRGEMFCTFKGTKNQQPALSRLAFFSLSQTNAVQYLLGGPLPRPGAPGSLRSLGLRSPPQSAQRPRGRRRLRMDGLGAQALPGWVNVGFG